MKDEQLNTMPMCDLFNNRGADFSNDRNYRYSLWRIWDDKKPLVMFIGLNPSTANEVQPDPTIKSVTRISKSNGFGGFYMMNCFAYVTSDPKLLKHNPFSDEWNNNMLIVTAAKCKAIVFAWGAFKVVAEVGRDKELIDMFPNALCIGINQNGSPKYPLFAKGKTQLISFKPINGINH